MTRAYLMKDSCLMFMDIGLLYGHDSRIGRIATTFKQNVKKISFLLNKNAWSVSWETDKTCILTEVCRRIKA
jgi:hypothetical protein